VEELSLHPDDRTIKPLVAVGGPVEAGKAIMRKPVYFHRGLFVQLALDTMDTMCVLAPLSGRRRVCACGSLGSASLNSRGPHEHLVVT
jgi:hypothetical protein